MIVTSEIYYKEKFGNKIPTLVVSYVDEQGQIKSLVWEIPEEHRYSWVYTDNAHKDLNYQSWNFKPVRKDYTKFKATDQRIHEILLEVIKMFPDMGIDSALFNLNTPDISFCDIEVDVDDTGFPDAESARNPINTCSWVNKDQVIVYGRAKLSSQQISNIQKRIDEHCKSFKTKYKFTYVYHESEYNLLNNLFINRFYPAPCITGWNFFGYDWAYLYNRAKKLNIDIGFLSNLTGNWTTYTPKNHPGMRIELPNHKLMYDYLEIYTKWDRTVSPKESNKLDWVAEKTLGVKKVQHQLGFKDMWEQCPEDYVFYNAVDSILVAEIDKKIKTSRTFYTLTNLLHTDALSTFSPVRSLEVVQCEFLYQQNKVFPLVNKKNERTKEGYEGAFVFEPIPGMYKNVISCDFMSLYPITIQQFNISPDTYVKKDKNYIPNQNEIKTTSGSIYTREFEGFLPQILKHFFKKRKEYKKEMIQAKKEKYILEETLEKRFGIILED